VFNSTGRLFTLDTNGNATFNGNVKGSSIGSSSTPINGSTGTFSDVINLSGGTLNKVAYGRFDSSGNLQPGSSNISGSVSHTNTGVYTITLLNCSSNYPVCVATIENNYGFIEIATPGSYCGVSVGIESTSGAMMNSAFRIICFMN
jgi:hypothetical protein